MQQSPQRDNRIQSLLTKNWSIKIWGPITIAILILFSLSTTVIEPGYKGLVFSLNGGVKEQVLDQGLNFHAPYPFAKITQYPVSTETVYLTQSTESGSEDQSFDVNTSDGKSVNVDVVYSYHMDANKLSHIFTKFRRQNHEQIQDNYLKTHIKTAMQEVTTNYSVLEIFTQKRSEITQKINERLRVHLGKDGIIIENFALSDVRPDSKTLKSLQAIADAQNKKELLQRSEQNIKQEVINKKLEAEGKKSVVIIEAEGKAEANKKLAESLSPEVVQYEWIKKWDGKLPKVQGGGNSPHLHLPSDLLKE